MTGLSVRRHVLIQVCQKSAEHPLRGIESAKERNHQKLHHQNMMSKAQPRLVLPCCLLLQYHCKLEELSEKKCATQSRFMFYFVT